MNVRLRKVVRDLWLQRGRAGLVVMAMALGVFGVVWISSSSSVLSRELEAQYLASSPPSIVITGAGITPEITADVRTLPGVAAAETTNTANVRIRMGSDHVPLRLFSRNDFTANTVARLTPQEGAWPPPDGQLVIERAALGVAKARVGGSVEVVLPGGQVRVLRVAGTVHDLGQAPAWQEGIVYGYVSATTLTSLGLSAEPTELRVLVDGDRLDVDPISGVVRSVANVLSRGGAVVDRVTVPVPGEHPHQSQMDSLLWLQQAFGWLALVLSGLLVSALMSAMLAGQVRQIGALKAVGGRTTQIAGSYAIMVALLAGSALAIGWPSGFVAARGYVAMVSAILNFDVGTPTLSPWLILAQVATGLAVPLSAAAVPVLRAARRTPAQAMADHGVSAPQRGGGNGALRMMSRIARPGAALMAMRNAIRRRGRLAITLVALSLGGATFVAALNLSTSLSSTMDRQADELRYDVTVTLDRPYPSAEAAGLALGATGVAAVEAWLSSPVTVDDDAPFTPSVPTLFGVPTDTTMLDLPVLSGRWLRPGDDHAIVVSHNFADDFPDARAGADIQLSVGGAWTTWHVVGVVRQVAAPPAAWVAYGDLAEVMGAGATTNALRILATSKDPGSLTATRRALDEALAAGDITVVDSRNLVETQQVLRDHILIIIVFFGLMTLLSVVIGGIGLATTMTINVVERTREIGMLRAIGATTRAVIAVVVIEGGLIGALSWLLAVVLSLPVSLVFGRVLGEIFLELPLDYAANTVAPFIWLGIVVILSGFASLAPARRAAALTVRDTLNYQ